MFNEKAQLSASASETTERGIAMMTYRLLTVRRTTSASYASDVQD